LGDRDGAKSGKPDDMALRMDAGVEWPTLLLLVLTYLVWGAATWAWSIAPLLALPMVAIATAQFSSLQHEALHGHPFRQKAVNEALVFPALMLVMPYQRFRDLHLRHHHDPTLTDPFDDPESNFCCPQNWTMMAGWCRALLRFNNTLAGRMLVGPALSIWALVRDDTRAALAGDGAVIRAWALNALGLVPVALWLAFAATMPVWAYVLAVYGGFSLLKIRTYLEHRAHEAARARTVIIEDRGFFALLFLNNNFHAVHHMHPGVAWYRLPALYAARKAHYLRRNEAYVYRSYAEIFRRHFLRAKDPVPHPMWPFATQTEREDAA
jgi:fatty acid desaturase